MKLEGKLVGPWVAECKQAWLDLNTPVMRKKLALDLCGMTFADDSGIALLRDIHRATGAEMLADSLLTRHFVEQVTGNSDQKKGD